MIKNEKIDMSKYVSVLYALAAISCSLIQAMPRLPIYTVRTIGHLKQQVAFNQKYAALCQTPTGSRILHSALETKLALDNSNTVNKTVRIQQAKKILQKKAETDDNHAEIAEALDSIFKS